MSKAQAITELTQLLGDRLSCSTSDRALHGASETYFASFPPDAVAYPQNTEEVSEIVKICARFSVPVIGYGVGTSLEAQTSAIQGGICVDFRNMNQVIQVNPEDMDVTVGAGITREELNVYLRDTGLFFPVDPGANASIGGMASTRASGTTAVRYGTMRDNVMGMTVVLANGEIIKTGTRARKSSAGYDLTGLFVGAEGTLGLICDLTLRLTGQPESMRAGIVAFDTMDGAVNAVIETIQMGLPMARIEFVDEQSTAAFNAYADADMPIAPHLLFELHGFEQGLEEQAELFETLCTAHGGQGFQIASKAEDRTALWTLRHNAYYAILALRQGARAVVTDICVPISKLAEAVSETQKDIAASGIDGPILGHVGDGNFHAILLIDPENAEEMQIAKDLAHRMSERALAMGGTCTGEHGIGIGKRPLMAIEHSSAWGTMGAIKAALDPQNIMNPGKLVPDRN
jgi:D-lactate dehydrogenase (cytochrome)